jgi:uncharacterized protein (TIGR02391 family)
MKIEKMNFRLIAIQVGDLLKYEVTEGLVDRLGGSIFQVRKESFPNEAIYALRARAVYNWIMSFAKKRLNEDERAKKILQFCMELSPEKYQPQIIEILEKNGCPYNIINKDSLDEFYKRCFHEEIILHSKKLFVQGNYFHAVFEAAKAYNSAVKRKSFSEKDGQGLMMDVFSLKGVLKLNTGMSDSERNVQEGIKFLSSGLMGAVRNPTAHEPAVYWPINKQDCLDLLSLISFLFRQLDSSTYYPY